MEVVTADQRAAARRTASRMLVETHRFLKLPVVLGTQQAWLHIPPFARLEDVLSCALKEPQLFPSSFDNLAAGPSVNAILELGVTVHMRWYLQTVLISPSGLVMMACFLAWAIQRSLALIQLS